MHNSVLSLHMKTMRVVLPLAVVFLFCLALAGKSVAKCTGMDLFIIHVPLNPSFELNESHAVFGNGHSHGISLNLPQYFLRQNVYEVWVEER